MSLKALFAAFAALALAVPLRAVDIERPIGAVPEAVTPVSAVQAPEIPALPTISAIPPIANAAVLSVNAVPEAAQGGALPRAAAMTAAVAQQAEAGLKTTATAGDSKEASANIQRIIEGRPAASASWAPVVSVGGNVGNGVVSNLAASDGASAEKTAPVPAPKTDVKALRKAYNNTRLALAAIAAGHNVVASLPMMHPALAAQITEEASYKNAVISDIDDTLDKFNSVLSPEAVKAIVAVRKAGKTFAAITDRPDKAKEGSSTKSAFETFSSIPKEERVGMIVATNGGGKIYEYDAQGEPKLIFSEKELEPEVRAKVEESAAAVKAEMEKRGVGLKADSAGPFGHSIIFALGTKMTDVKDLAHLFEKEMKSRGLSFEVEPREAKNPAVDPPYITFSKLNKSLATKHIAELKGIRAEDALILGDSMYKPNPDAQAPADVIAYAEKLSGQKIPLTGNLVDRNMELALPGALTLSVGATADPRMQNAWVMPVTRDANGRVQGPIVTHKILEAVASRRKGEEPPLPRWQAWLIMAFLVGAALFGWFTFYAAMTGALSPAAQPPVEYQVPFNIGPNFPFGN